MASSSEPRSRFLVLVLLSALLGAGIWIWDKHLRDRDGEPRPEPIVVSMADVAPPTPDELATGQPQRLETIIVRSSGADAPGGEGAPEIVNIASNGAGGVAFAPEDLAEDPDEIESFDAYVTDDGIVLEWVSGVEDDSLGYRIFRIGSDGSETLVADLTTAAAGDGELYKLMEPGKGGGRFVIDRVNADLSTRRLPLNATARMLAPPEEGLHVLMIQAEDGEAELDIGTEARNLFVIGFRNKPVVEDLTDPENPRVLVGETISLRGEQAVYFKADSFATIHVRDP